MAYEASNSRRIKTSLWRIKMRKEFGKVIVELAEKDKNVILIVGDIGYGIFNEFRKRFPDRFFNFGIREQSIVSMAAGMALEGLKPYVYTITPFLIERAFEQVKLDIDQQNVNVKLVGYDTYFFSWFSGTGCKSNSNDKVRKANLKR